MRLYFDLEYWRDAFDEVPDEPRGPFTEVTRLVGHRHTIEVPDLAKIRLRRLIVTDEHGRPVGNIHWMFDTGEDD